MRYGLALVGVVATVLLTFAMVFTAGWTRPPIVATQSGYRGTGLDQIASQRDIAMQKVANVLPDVIEKASPDGDRATAVYQNVQVLTDLSADQFNRVMLAITNWVAPDQGCTYCHNAENLADDSLYTKKVARRMLQMTRHINTDLKAHVGETGVTCYTCHRGQPVPLNVWYNDTERNTRGFATDNVGFGHPSNNNGLTGMPADPFTAYIEANEQARVVATQALPIGKGAPIMTTERTYSLMIHMSEALGVNCTFCHNTRAFSQWPESTPQRVTAWQGLQMARDLNVNYLDPLKVEFPANRLGHQGDAPKLNCATCHQGVNKPLGGAPMAKDYPELQGVAVKTP